MDLYKSLQNREKYLSVIGLGYVGMPLAIAFAKKVNVIGYDINQEKIALYRQGIDPTCEIGNAEMKITTMQFTCEEKDLQKAGFHIIAVPTPINQDKTPDLSPVIKASKMLGRNLRRGAMVVYESTVYPGVTEEICIPLLEKESGLCCGEDFKVGYSPERINPGDRIHRLENIKKIVSGIDEAALDLIAAVYEWVIDAGVHRVSSIKVAEAAKVVENSQRDINIAFMNELAMVFDRMQIDTNEVIDAMNTKWNALQFRPGLVGGHCIGIDPYYFIYQAENLGYHSQIVLAGRKVNDDMSKYVTDAIIKQLILANLTVKQVRMVIFGITFKENCPDIRNSKVKDILVRLREYGIQPVVVDPWASKHEVKLEYGIELVDINELKEMDALVFAVAHDQFKQMRYEEINRLYDPNVPISQRILIDIKGLFRIEDLQEAGYSYWRL